MSESDKCQKHGQDVIFICSMQNCKDHRLICEVCKQKETLHFSHHANYIYRSKQLKEFNNGKNTIPRLEKGIQDCQNSIVVHKKFYQQEIMLVKEDFALIKQQFNKIADTYQNIYVEGFQKQMDKFDADIMKLKQVFKEYVNEKNQQSSFFTNLFERKKDDNDIQTLINKNTKAFQVRADIINLRKVLDSVKNNKSRYKASETQMQIFHNLRQHLTDFSNSYFDRFKELLESKKETGSLRSSIVSETKSLAMSRVSLGTPLQEMRRNSSFSSEKNFKRVEMPELNPIVKSIWEKLKPFDLSTLAQNKNIEGPYLYSSGVYQGQFQIWKRSGWGTFIFNDGCIYQGFWENDMMSGQGRLIKKNCFYEGQIKEGRANGIGNYEDEFRTYSGEWKNDKRNGMGEEEFRAKKKKFIGYFVNDKYQGKGKLFDEDFTYEGKFKAGLFEGKGKIIYNNRQIFQGDFNEGYKLVGKHTYPDGSYYEGQFKNNLPEGKGEFFWADGIRYLGIWRGGFQEGEGSQVTLDGRQLRGVWKNGQWQKWV